MREQIAAFLNFCRMEKGLAANSLDAYGRDLRRFAGFTRPAPGDGARRRGPSPLSRSFI